MNMKLPRRQFLHLAADTIGLAATSRMAPYKAWAQTYPTRPVRLIVPFGPGGGTDIVARLIGQWLSERLGHTFVIENRPGAGGNLGTEAVVRAPPDGYTLALIGAPSAINATLYDNLTFNFIRDIAPVAMIVRFPNVLVVNPSVPARTTLEFIAYAKANPGKLNMASPGNGSTPHVAGELFKMMTGVTMVHVPYRSVAAGLTDMLSGQVQVTFGTAASTIEYIRAGTLRALAVTTAMRSEALPDLPTIAEVLPGYEATAWFGVGAPRNTPADIIDKLNRDINACLADPKLQARIADLGGIAITGSPADFGRLIVEETEKWAKVVKFSGAKAE
jgi:tripartite-type tricarboxylate transporter receptor subunit TctC